MKISDIISAAYGILTKWSKSRLLRTIEILRDGYRELSEKCSELEAENEKLKEELKIQKIKAVNRDANKPSSKQPEWDKKGVGNDGKGRKNGKGRGRKPRKGAGNRPKKLESDRMEKATVDRCSLCGRDLSDDAPLETINGRIIEDIPSMIERPEVIKIEQVGAWGRC